MKHTRRRFDLWQAADGADVAWGPPPLFLLLERSRRADQEPTAPGPAVAARKVAATAGAAAFIHRSGPAIGGIDPSIRVFFMCSKSFFGKTSNG